MMKLKEMLKSSRQEIIDSIEDPIDKQLEQDIYDSQKKWDYDTMDATLVFSNRIADLLTTYTKAYPDMDFSKCLRKAGI